MNTRLSHSIRRLLALAAVLAAASTAGLTAEAQALNPEQTSVTNTINIVYWDLDRFWIPSQKPGVSYYDYVSGGVLVNYETPCGNTLRFLGAQGFLCPANAGIYFDFNQQVGNIRTYRDGAVAFWLAHEYGHQIQQLLGINWRAFPPYHELLADCFAGMYFRYGVNTSRKLVYADYNEARNQIWALVNSDADHGTRSQRLRAFDFGYTQAAHSGCTSSAGRSY
jgi:predicted metalloprotease